MGSTADTSYFLLIVSYSCNASGVTAGQAELYVEANQTFQEQKGSSSQSLFGGLQGGWAGKESSAGFGSKQHAVAGIQEYFRIAKISHKSKKAQGEIKEGCLWQLRAGLSRGSFKIVK